MFGNRFESLILAGFVCISSCVLSQVTDYQTSVTWDGVYEGDVRPSLASPAWSENQGAECEMTQEDGLLHLVDRGTMSGSICHIGRGLRIMPADVLTVEARLRVVSASGENGVAILLANGAREEVFNFLPGRVVTRYSKQEASFDTTDGFHVFRVVIEGEDYALFADAELLVNGAGLFTQAADGGREEIRAGAISSAPTGESYWDYLRYRVEQRGPREEIATEASARHVVVFKEMGVYACFPSLLRASDGALYTQFGANTIATHWSHGGTRGMVSRDDGKTWRRVATSEVPVNPAYFSSDGMGVRAQCNGYRYAEPSEREAIEARGVEVRDTPNGKIGYAEGCYVETSEDAGKSWSRRDLAVPPKALINVFHDIATWLRYDDNVIMRSVYGRPRANVDYYESWLLRSEDNGGIWDFVTVGALPEEGIGLGETAILKTSNGDIISMMRSQPPDKWKYLYMSRSTDQGKTWSKAANTGIHGHPADLLRLANGHILCTYGFREKPMGIRAVFSHDDGKTWDVQNTRILRADGFGSGGDLGYPISAELADGSLFTIYYITTEEGITHIAGTSWRE